MAVGESLLTVQDVEAAAAGRGEPQWLRELRRQAAAEADRLSWPRVGKTTPLAGLPWTRYRPNRDAGTADQPPVSGGPEQAGLAVMVNGRLVRRELDDAWARQGVVLQDLVAAAAEREAVVAPYLWRALSWEENRVVAWQAALWDGGLFVYVPPGVRVERPLRVVHRFTGEGAAVFPHVLLVVGAGARLAYLEEYRGEARADLLHLGALEVVAEDGAEVQVGSVQNLPHGVRSLVWRRAWVRQDASVTWSVAELGDGMSVTEVASLLDSPGAKSSSFLVFLGTSQQILDITCRMAHRAPQTDGTMEARGVLAGEAQATYFGLTDIDSVAVQSRGWQREHTLLLSPQARVDAIPALEIDTDDVVAGHAASAGQIDEEQLFYLMSRGIPRDLAVRLVVTGFLKPILDRIPLPEVQAAVAEVMERKIRP